MEFLRYIIYAAMLAEVVILIMPSGSMKKYVKLSAGILITLMLLSPIASCSNENISAGKIITDVYNDLLQNTN